ncbi:PAR14 polymerase [Biomphalaria glabrata]|nr:PAR14 polymerase [Biomphalaria glabrata]
MEQLVLISGFHKETENDKLKELADNYFKGKKLLMVWRDPNKYQRAVLMFQEAIDLRNSLKSHFEALKNEGLVVCVVKPTQYIIVQTYNANKFGLIDKLGLLFMKESYTLDSKIRLDDACFKIEFKAGWDAVLQVCTREWRVNETKITVSPYFQCFEECYDNQYQSLEVEFKNIFETLLDMDHIQAVKSIPLSNDTHTELTENKQVVGIEDKRSFIFFTNTFIPHILQDLNIVNAAGQYNCKVIFVNMEEAKVEGPKSIMKKLFPVIKQEVEQVSNLLESSTVINKEYIKTSKHILVFSEANEKFTMNVAQENCETIPFNKYVSSMLLKKSLNEEGLHTPTQSMHGQENAMTFPNEKAEYEFLYCSTLGILKALKFEHLIENKYAGTIVKYENMSKVFITGPLAETIVSTLKQEEEEISLDEEKNYFLSQEKVLDSIGKLNHQIDFCDSSKMLVKMESQTTLSFSEFVNNLVIVEHFGCGETEPASLNVDIDSFNEQHSFCKMLFAKGKVTFLCLSSQSEYKEIILHHFKEAIEVEKSNSDAYIIKNHQKETNNLMNEATSNEMDTSTNRLKKEFTLNIYQQMYCEKFIGDLKKERGVADIELEQNTLRVFFKPYSDDYSFVIFDEKLKALQHKEVHLEFSGLTQFAKLVVGEQLISYTSQRSKCCIHIPDKHNPVRQMEEIETESFDYKVILLYSARCGGYKIHLAQGHINDIKTKMSVGILPAQNDEISVKRSTSQHYNLLLPAWSLREDDPDFLDRLRDSFQLKIDLIFKQAIHLGYSDVAFSMENIYNENISFPIDLIAKTIIEQLLSEGLYTNNGATSVGWNFDVYICEPFHESIFKAFEYYLKKYGCYFGPPDQEKWDHISTINTFKYMEYSTNTVSIISSNPSSVSGNILFCYPILPSLEPHSCPVVNEFGFSVDNLKMAIQIFEDGNPDGIPVNGYFPVKNFQWNYKDVVIYCCQGWGPDVDMAIYESLQTCLSLATNKSAVHIVPPGVQMSQYPARYLAQSVFKALDNLFAYKPQHLKIVFVVENKEYEKAFNNELKKRCPSTKNSKSLYNSIHSAVTSLFSNTKKAEPQNKKSFIEKTSIVFVSTTPQIISDAISSLTSELKELMNKYTVEITLTCDERRAFEVISNNDYGHPVFWELSIFKSDKNTSISKLKVQGLHMDWVKEFENEIKQKIKHASSSVDLNFNRVKKILNDEQKQPKSAKETNKTKAEEDSSKSVSKNNQNGKKQTKTNSHGKAQNKDIDSKEKEAKFTWKYENEKINSFEEFHQSTVTELEHYFTVDVTTQKRLHQALFKMYNFVDFSKMKLSRFKTSETGNDTTIIRSEIVEEDDTITFPPHWKKNKTDAFEFVEADKSLEYVKKALDEVNIFLELMHKFEIISFKEVQNKKLFRRFQTKCKLIPEAKKEFLWCRLSEENVSKVCQFGFHKIFSFPRNIMNTVDGVAFTSNISTLFSLNELKSESDAYLIYAEVIIGNSAQLPDKKIIRSPPSGKQAKQKFHSVFKDDIFVIFSDAQAYPVYLIHLGNINK